MKLVLEEADRNHLQYGVQYLIQMKNQGYTTAYLHSQEWDEMFIFPLGMLSHTDDDDIEKVYILHDTRRN